MGACPEEVTASRIPTRCAVSGSSAGRSETCRRTASTCQANASRLSSSVAPSCRRSTSRAVTYAASARRAETSRSRSRSTLARSRNGACRSTSADDPTSSKSCSEENRRFPSKWGVRGSASIARRTPPGKATQHPAPARVTRHTIRYSSVTIVAACDVAIRLWSSPWCSPSSRCCSASPCRASLRFAMAGARNKPRQAVILAHSRARTRGHSVEPAAGPHRGARQPSDRHTRRFGRLARAGPGRQREPRWPDRFGSSPFRRSDSAWACPTPRSGSPEGPPSGR